MPQHDENATSGSRFRISGMGRGGAREGGASSSRRLSPTVWKVLAAIAVVIVVLGASARGFVIQRFTIPSESMQPTLMAGDTISVWRPDALGGRIDRGDIVVFDGRGSFVDDALPTPLQKIGSWVGVGPRDVYFVKRVIALGGDTVECCDAQGRLLLNGEPLNEEYAPLPASATEFSTRIPQGTMWVMGDNRNDSADSRALLGRPGGGFIPVDRVIGPVIGHGSSID
ncbi:signal peptidase I [Mycobacteroides abscessus subsp. abscessus]|uniref:Signal peptidase I n=4 Tax=Brevibacterium casei TaxID=33889 RepID=K9AZN1_9MICO|nr:signal peptidase I [Brevibacterium casei]EKU46965.1 signal peptidase I LepB [Brevibacterium casei S18]NJE65383.1 signal peptidase I [Brevibacterium sp. LS14]SIG98475.1 signal peptidase I [Mycobacteroides abscessus subsp. abscessus]SMX95331.1 signal peptidase I [Brevibacterium casei CIP 102111]KZE22827.1 S26 family signal peptidase [Brevibacterium casei]